MQRIDKIKRMDATELAYHILDNSNCETCPALEPCKNNSERNCVDEVKAWLLEDTNKLKNCPFCNGEYPGDLIIITVPCTQPKSQVVCTGCGACGPTVEGDDCTAQDSAADEWNKRIVSTELWADKRRNMK